MDSLQSSMLGALEHDQRKQQVNDAKMRAVKQHVEYDDFEKLVAELTAPGGVRAAVPRDQMRKFVAACAARDVCEAVCVLLASCLSAEVRP